MSEYTKDEALAFIEAIRLSLNGRVGFKWLVEKLSALSAYVELIAVENDRLNAYLVWANAEDDFEAFREAHIDVGSEKGRS
ncbi:MAG: hypothetical protein Q8K89_12780 [Actinomycetota bacterium]|nr:hypothetical protein [Actinomycetota bacterium]